MSKFRPTRCGAWVPRSQTSSVVCGSRIHDIDSCGKEKWTANFIYIMQWNFQRLLRIILRSITYQHVLLPSFRTNLDCRDSSFAAIPRHSNPAWTPTHEPRGDGILSLCRHTFQVRERCPLAMDKIEQATTGR